MRYVRHIVVIVSLILMIVGIPVYKSGYIQRRLRGVDAISSATVIIERPSGEYVVIINPELHRNKENLEIWESFFSGGETDFLFEDISCVVGDTDTSGLEIARSFQSRLPENQMTVRTEDMILMLSKAVYGRYDVIIMSRDMYDAYSADTSVGDGIVICGG